MKKKALTTVMALAMLAPTASAFASTTTVTGNQNATQTSDLNISGTVNNSQGQAPAGQISVTLPTAVSFVVDQDGIFTAANTMMIENNSQIGISVSVSAFSDTTPTPGAGITVIDESTLGGDEAAYDRSYVSLSLQANGGTSGATVSLLSSGFQETKLVDLGASATTGLSLVGNAGTAQYSSATNKGTTNADATGVNDNFTLTFKIAKQ